MTSAKQLPGILRIGLATIVLAWCAACATPTDELERRSSAIVSGAASEDPNVIALMADGRFRCSAVLVSPHVALTAAHCVEDADVRYEVALGQDPMTSTDRYGVIAVEANPEYGEGSFYADLAALRLDASPAVEPAAIHDRTLSGSDVGDLVRIAGFGLRSSPAGEEEVVPRKTSGFATLAAMTDWNMTLTPGPDGSQPCVGDSGGPAFLWANGRYELVGIHSFGDETCSSLATAVRTDAFAETFLDRTIVELEWMGTPNVGLSSTCAAFGPGSGTSRSSTSFLLLILALFVARRFRRSS